MHEGMGMNSAALVTDPVSATPQFVSITITSRCNLRCVMCYHATGRVEKKDFSADMLGKLSGFISDAKLIELTGLGEPMLSDTFWDFLAEFPYDRHASDEQFVISFNCNGTLLNARNTERLLASRIRRIRFSLDGASEDVLFRIRGVHASDMRDRVGTLIKERNRGGRRYPLIGFQMTLMNENLAEIPDVLDSAADLGCDFVEIWTLNNLPKDGGSRWIIERENWTFDYTSQQIDGIDLDVLGTVVDQAHERARSRHLPLFTMTLGFARWSDGFPADRWDELRIPWNDRSIRCDQPWKEFRTTYDGDVFPCCWATKPVGRLGEASPRDIWTSGDFNQVRTDLVAGIIPEACSGAGCPHVLGRNR
ncbi:radical SAM protein [Methylobacterium nonmethylotrophicum]|uniref:Radical SAM protein n=1 Tax=Methylobacterium nonmethylotrophicum TaxID=1141884 RepID=A0A4Z0NL08_9HYPH|nr:radical SAM protein [Methylobacterium nonmethylotrophicum]TGD96912.1 radical SAM protein [Methylobacterium nonmethylotrophicum]